MVAGLSCRGKCAGGKKTAAKKQLNHFAFPPSMNDNSVIPNS